MADYYAILKRAISALPEPTGESRRAVYEKARTALVAQLKSFDPPLSASDITQQRLQLEDAIRKVESEAAKGLLTQALSRAALPERPTAATGPTGPTAQPMPEAASRAAAPAPTPQPASHQPAPAPARPVTTERPFTAQPERATTGPTGMPASTGSAPTGPAPGNTASTNTGPTSAARAFVRTDREPTGQPRPPLTRSEPTGPTQPRPQTAARNAGYGAVTGQRPASPPEMPPALPGRQPPQLPFQAPPTSVDTYNEPPPFTRERATGASQDAYPAADYEQEDVTQPVASRAFRSAVKDIDRLGAAAQEAARRARDQLAASDVGATAAGPTEQGRRSGRRPLTARDTTTDTKSAPPPLNPPVVVPRRASRWPVIAGLVAVAVVVLGGGGLYWKRDVIAHYLGVQKPAIEIGQRTGSEKPFVKATDRLPTDDGTQKAPANSGVKVVTTQPISPTGDSTSAPASTTPGTTNPAPTPNVAATNPATPAATPTPSAPVVASSSNPATATTTAPAAPLPSADVPPIAQKASLLEEATDGTSPPVQTEGKVIWQLQRTPSTQPGKPDTVRLQGRVEVPGRGITLLITMEQNADPGLQASHLIKLEFKLPQDFDNKSVGRVPGIILKPAESARGDPLAGATAKITSNLFWIALYSADADRTRNLQLLKDRGWIDIPIVYETNKRAMLTLEKAGAGDRVFSDAIAAWGG